LGEWPVLGDGSVTVEVGVQEVRRLYLAVEGLAEGNDEYFFGLGDGFIIETAIEDRVDIQLDEFSGIFKHFPQLGEHAEGGGFTREVRGDEVKGFICLEVSLPEHLGGQQGLVGVVLTQHGVQLTTCGMVVLHPWIKKGKKGEGYLMPRCSWDVLVIRRRA